MYAKFQVQKTYPKKDIQSLPTCVLVVRMIFCIPKKLDPQNNTIPKAEKIILRTTHVGSFLISFFCKSFELEIWNTYFQHREDLMKKIYHKKLISQPLEGCQSW